MWIVLLVVVALSWPANGVIMHQPEQVHLSMGDDPSEMVVTWVTADKTSGSIVEYGVTSKLGSSENGSYTEFIDGGSESRSMYIHRVKLTGLKPVQMYFYHCGSSLGWSEMFYFTSLKTGNDWSPKFAVFGDMGNKNAHSLSYLQNEAQTGQYDMAIHVGDFAYNMDTDNARVGDEFMRQIQALAGYVPYMTCPGNHEAAYNFSNYKARFSMPRTDDNMMYSFDVGPVHFIAVSTEYYYFTNYGVKQIVNQYEWVLKDLQEAAKHRAERPWIVVFGHRPMYCSNNDHDDCTRFETLIRVGIPFFHWFGLEKIFYEYGVDLEIWAHEHSYERMWPVYDRKVYNGSLDQPYVNPKAPVHITTGSAGCQEGTDPFRKVRPPWSAFCNSDYGYARLHVFNHTHLYMEQVSVDQGKVIDSFMIVKDTHGPFEAVADDVQPDY